MSDAAETVNHPKHYNAHSSGIECIDIVELMPFNLGNAVKYLWRVGHKGDDLEQLQKAHWYLAREVRRIEAILALERSSRELVEFLAFGDLWQDRVSTKARAVIACEERGSLLAAVLSGLALRDGKYAYVGQVQLARCDVDLAILREKTRRLVEETEAKVRSYDNG